MTDYLLFVHVVIETLNLEISRCYLADYVKEFYLSPCCPCCTIIFPYSTNQIIVFWCRLCRRRRLCFSCLFSGDVLVSAAVVAASYPYLLSNNVPSPCQDGPRYFVGQEVDVPMEIPEGVDDVSAAVYDPDGNLMRSTFRREADGLFHLRFTPTKAGMHKVS